MKRSIAVVTGTRAEYGLLRHLIKLINDSDEFELQLVVTGSHLSKKFGETYKTEGRRTLQHDKTDRALYTKTKNGLVRYDYTPEGRIQSVSLQYLAGENKKIQTIKVNPESGQVLGGGVNADSLQSMVSDVQNTLNADIMSL